MAEIMTLDEAARSIPDGSHLGIGGVVLHRKPMAMLAAMVRRGVRDLTVSSFLASLDVEILIAGGCVRRVRTGYVGFEHRGGAPLFRKAFAKGAIGVEAHSELTFLNALEAAASGLPFLPTKGAIGSAPGRSGIASRRRHDPHPSRGSSWGGRRGAGRDVPLGRRRRAGEGCRPGRRDGRDRRRSAR